LKVAKRVDLKSCFFKKDFIYLRERTSSGEAQRERKREADSLLSRKPNVGLDLRTLRS